MRLLISAAALATVVATASTAQATALAQSPAATTFVDTATKAFPMVRGVTNLGVAASALPLHIVVGLKMRNRALVDMILRRQITAGDMLYGRFLTPSQSNMMFSPTGTQVQAVATYLKASGFTNIAVTGDNMLVTADGTAAVANKAFATQIDILSIGGKRIFANVSNAKVPSSLGGAVTAVLGLNNLPMHFGPKLATRQPVAAAPACQQSLSGLCVLNSYTATGFQLAYDSPQHSGNTNTWGYTGKNTNIAIFAEGHIANVLTDLRTYETKNVPVLPQVPVSVIYTGIPSPDVSGQDEFDLDTQSSTGIAGNVKKLYLYVATSLTDADTSREFDQFALDDYAKAGSASFGECEIFPATDGALVLDDTIFARAAVQGQTIFSSAGDNGTTCPVVASTGVPGTGLPFQSYPGNFTLRRQRRRHDSGNQYRQWYL